MDHFEIHLDEGLRVVGLRPKLGLRGTLQGGDNLGAPKGIAHLQLAVRVERQRVYPEIAERCRVEGSV